jgi:hypothetical protein
MWGKLINTEIASNGASEGKPWESVRIVDPPRWVPAAWR